MRRLREKCGNNCKARGRENVLLHPPHCLGLSPKGLKQPFKKQKIYKEPFIHIRKKTFFQKKPASITMTAATTVTSAPTEATAAATTISWQKPFQLWQKEEVFSSGAMIGRISEWPN